MPEQQPLITFVIPCYNSAAFMRRCIDSVLAANHPCEILIINDGSTDSTGEIAHEYAQMHEHVFAIDQENANWGGVVNHGLELARGKYFKIVDSDDRLFGPALHSVLDQLDWCIKNNQEPDLLVTNFVYDHLSDKAQHVIQYRKLFPSGRLFTWEDMGTTPAIDQFIMVHASWFKTEVLRESHVKLPTKASYMDSLFVLRPLQYVNTLFYLDVNAYYYIIGREGQSVEIEVVKKHIDEQLLATVLAINDADYVQIYEKSPNQAMLMMGYISCMMSVSTIHLFKINTPESLEKNRLLWAYMKQKNPTLYKYVRKSWAGWANRKTALGRLAARGVYTIAQKIFKFA